MLNTNITGETMIFKNEKGFYSTTLSKRTLEGNYENGYIPVSFKKGTELENMTKINIKSAWLTFDKYEKDGKKNTIFKIFINDFEKVGSQQTTTKAKESNNGFEDDLPF